MVFSSQNQLVEDVCAYASLEGEGTCAFGGWLNIVANQVEV